MNTCKTCIHWRHPDKDYTAEYICVPIDPGTHKPMQIEFEVRLYKQPNQALLEAPAESNGFALTDASDYYAALATGEVFGCSRHEAATE